MGRGCSSVAWTSGPARFGRRFDSPVLQGIFLPELAFGSDCGSVRTPLSAIACVKVSAHIQNLSYRRPHRGLETRKYSTRLVNTRKRKVAIQVDSRGLTFSWWGRSGLCPWHKPTELAYSFYSVLVSVSVLWLFQLYLIPQSLPTTLCFLTLFFWSYFCLIGPFQLYISLWKSPSVLI